MRCRKPYFRMRAAGISATFPPMLQSIAKKDRARRNILAARRVRDVEIDDSGFHDHAAHLEDQPLEDAIHSRQADDNPIFNGERAPLNPVPEPARHERDSFTVTNSTTA